MREFLFSITLWQLDNDISIHMLQLIKAAEGYHVFPESKTAELLTVMTSRAVNDNIWISQIIQLSDNQCLLNPSWLNSRGANG